MIISRIFKEHMTYLRQTFSCLVEYNITIKRKKCFIGYLSVIVLRRRIDSFRLLTIEEKLAVIKNLLFLRTIKDLETYLGMAR